MLSGAAAVPWALLFGCGCAQVVQAVPAVAAVGLRRAQVSGTLWA